MARPLKKGMRPVGAAALKQLREDIGLSTMELAYHAGINLTTLAYLESGRSDIKNMRLGTAAGLAHALGLSMSEFIDYLGFGDEKKEEGQD